MNPFFHMVPDQKVALIPEFAMENGDIIREVPLAYKTWGTLNAEGNNVMVICHALTGSADVSDWWGPLLGPGLAFDPERYFIICINALGSPYGSASPVTINPETGKNYGPEFPLATVKDDARIQRLLLDDLGVKQIAVVIGGSMGGMLALEYAYWGKSYVKELIALATCATHSAWGISWGEAQRQSIYSDPKYLDGYYSFDDPPVTGLAAARMSALLTYRSRDSFERRFSRELPDPSRNKNVVSSSREPETVEEERWAVHNHGHLGGRKLASPSASSTSLFSKSGSSSPTTNGVKPQHYFTAQSYLRYQGNKFISRFDANCYISITRKIDTHDVSRGRANSIPEALELIEQPTLIIGITSDGLFTCSEQKLLARYIPGAQLAQIESPEGHDAFLLEFKEINKLICDFLLQQLPELYENWKSLDVENNVTKTSVFGESEAVNLHDVTSW